MKSPDLDAREAAGGSPTRQRPTPPARAEQKAQLAAATAREARLRARIAELESSNERLEEYAWVVAHDLQEGLSTIGLLSETLAMKLEPDLDPARTRTLANIRAGVKRMSSLVRETLADARGRTPSEAHRLLATDAVVDNALANMTARVKELDAKIVREPLPWTVGDEAALMRLFQNLLANALDNPHPDRRLCIRIGARRHQQGWLFEVIDNGVGIPPDMATRELELARLPSAADRQSGSGFGLGICAQIIAAHGGRGAVELRPEGGTIVTFLLPRT